MNEYIVFLIVVIFVLIILFIKGMYDYSIEKKRFLIKIRQDYGKPPNKEYAEGRFSVLSNTSKRGKKPGCIDDITWNDLDMDGIFGRLDYTFSAAGEEALYQMLRHPELAEANLNNREEKIQYFMNEEDKRVRFQLQFAQIGRTGKHSIIDYLDYLNNLKEEKLLKDKVMLAAIFFAAVYLFFNFTIGIILLFSLLAINMMWYFPVHKRIAPYLTTFSYLLMIIKSIDVFEKINVPVFEHELSRLKELKKNTKKFTKHSAILFGNNGLKTNPLEIIMDYLKMCLHIDIFKFYYMLKEAKGHRDEFAEMFYLLGNMEAVISIGAYRESLTYYSIPAFTKKKAIYAEQIYHPLIEEPVANSFKEERGMLLTGSNASGKSTFLKTVAINAILAQTIHTCLAIDYTTDFFRIYSSMALKDDLTNKESYFIVEIKALKRVMDAAALDERVPVLCFIDEVLRGTNTVERIAASTEILKKLASGNCLCFAATHDIELTTLLSAEYDNYHFEETILDNDVKFNYLLKQGKATTRNAIKLLRVMRYEEEVIEMAENRAQDFMLNGNWEEGMKR